MKKILTIIFMASVAFCVNAQTFQDNYTYGFWSNWSLGGAPVLTKTFSPNWRFGQDVNIGIDIRGQKQISKHWDARFIAETPGLVKSDSIQTDRYAKGLIGFDWTPWKHFYMFADGGLGVNCNADSNRTAFVVDAGVGLKWNVCKHSRIFCEAGIDVIDNIKTDVMQNNLFIKAGYQYNFGLTKVDQEIIAQRNMVKGEFTQDTINVLNNKIESCIIAEKALIEKIACLEQHDSSLHNELVKVRFENDSLRNVLNSVISNNINYFAIPFSIQFDNDSYKINHNEIQKIKSVANIMKADTSVRYTISGFCDNTGTREYNQKLSEKRANAVKQALMKYGVKEEQIDVNGYGKDMPFGDSSEAINRRVSFYRNF